MKKIFFSFLGLPVRAKICGVSFGRFGHEKAEIQLKNAESCEFQIHPEGDGKVKFRIVFNFDFFLVETKNIDMFNRWRSLTGKNSLAPQPIKFLASL